MRQQREKVYIVSTKPHPEMWLYMGGGENMCSSLTLFFSFSSCSTDAFSFSVSTEQGLGLLLDMY